MKSLPYHLIIMLFVFVALSSYETSAQNTVQVSIMSKEYDVVYVADLVDVRTRELRSSIPGFSVTLSTDEVNPISISLWLRVTVQMRGQSPRRLIEGYTNNFDLVSYRRFEAQDFTSTGTANLYIRGKENDGYYHYDSDLESDLQSKAETIPTAPPGNYTVEMQVYPAWGSGTPNNTPGSPLSPKVTTSIVIPLATVDEVFVEITEPREGAFFSNLAPTFNWTTSSDKVRVRVFEAGPNHRSPQDALSGASICLDRRTPLDFTGNTLTYPADAQRQLQQDKAYVLQVDAQVMTNRGEVNRPGRPIVFRITNDNVGTMLENFLNTVGGAANATYTTLRTEPSSWVYWSIYGRILLDGQTLSETDLQNLLNLLAGEQDLKLQLSVENQ